MSKEEITNGNVSVPRRRDRHCARFDSRSHSTIPQASSAKPVEPSNRDAKKCSRHLPDSFAGQNRRLRQSDAARRTLLHFLGPEAGRALASSEWLLHTLPDIETLRLATTHHSRMLGHYLQMAAKCHAEGIGLLHPGEPSPPITKGQEELLRRARSVSRLISRLSQRIYLETASFRAPHSTNPRKAGQ